MNRRHGSTISFFAIRTHFEWTDCFFTTILHVANIKYTIQIWYLRVDPNSRKLVILVQQQIKNIVDSDKCWISSCSRSDDYLAYIPGNLSNSLKTVNTDRRDLNKNQMNF